MGFLLMLASNPISLFHNLYSNPVRRAQKQGPSWNKECELPLQAMLSSWKRLPRWLRVTGFWQRGLEKQKIHGQIPLFLVFYIAIKMLIGLRKSLLKNYHSIFNTDGIQTSFTKANHEMHISASFHPWSYSPFWNHSHSHSLVIIKAGLTVSCK